MNNRAVELEKQAAEILRSFFNLPAGSGTPALLVQSIVGAALERLKDELAAARLKAKGK